MTLYNCKVDGDQFRISKFDKDLNVEASYLCTEAECECPAGHRDTCRHRKMLPRFITKQATRGQWFYNYDLMRWVEAEAVVEFEESSERDRTASEIGGHPVFKDTMEALRASAAAHGFTMLDLANPGEVHNAIAEAVGEPIIPQPKPLRRL